MPLTLMIPTPHVHTQEQTQWDISSGCILVCTKKPSKIKKQRMDSVPQ